MMFINYLTRISKDCDCLPNYKNIVPDIGVLVSYDPVAVDAAAVALVEQKAGKEISEIAYSIPYRYQIDYAREIGFDEGPKHPDWVAELERRGIAVERDLERSSSVDVLRHYVATGGDIYNAGEVSIEDGDDA